jgi:hypothetical protein
MHGIKLTIVLKQKFPVGAMAPFATPCGCACTRVLRNPDTNLSE